MKVRARLRVSACPMKCLFLFYFIGAAKKMNLNVGLLVNFKHPKAEIKRMVLNLSKGHDFNFDDDSSSK